MSDRYETIIQESDFIGAKRVSSCKCLVAKALERVTGVDCSVCYKDAFVGKQQYRFVEGQNVARYYDRGYPDHGLIGMKVVIERMP